MCLTCAPPRAPEALLRSHGARVSKIMPPESLGVTLGAHVGHLVTYRDPYEGALIYTIFTKKCQKRCKKGAPPVFDRQLDGVTY